MPHEQMNEQQVASYVHLDVREVTKLASRGQIPCRRVQGGFVFHKGRIDLWLESHIHTLDSARLAGIERGVGTHHGFEIDQPLICPMIPRAGLAVPLQAKTRAAVVKSLVDLADQAGLVYAKDELIQELRQREELCSTALCPGVALPHPRHPLPYDIADSFVVVGLTASGVPYGCPDGSLTRLFFLICCKDDRTHLHVLARLANMLHDRGDINHLMETSDCDELTETLERLEASALQRRQ